MGINRDLVVPSSNVDFCICPICHDLLDAVVFVARCEHYFCRPCIEGWIEASPNERFHSCPECRSEFTRTDLSTPRIIRHMLSSIMIQCEFAKCNVTVGYDDYQLES